MISWLKPRHNVWALTDDLILPSCVRDEEHGAQQRDLLRV